MFTEFCHENILLDTNAELEGRRRKHPAAISTRSGTRVINTRRLTNLAMAVGNVHVYKM